MSKEPNEEIINQLLKIRAKRKKPFFDNKTQLDLNCFFISSLVHAHNAIPDQNFLSLAEEIFANIEKKFCKGSLFHSSSKSVVFLEDYAYLINCLIDLNDQTLNSKYRIQANKFCKETINLFYLKHRSIFQKNIIKNNDIFIEPVDISDHTVPNGNSLMLINFTRLGFKKESQDLANSLNSYLNTYKTFMISSLKSIDFHNEISSGKSCGIDGCKI